MKFLITSFCFFISITIISSQNFDLAGVHYFNYPNSSVKNRTNDQEFSIQEFGAFLNIPDKLKNNKTVIIHGIRYDLIEAKANNLSLFDASNKKRLHKATYKLTVVHKWNEKWNFIANISPTFASDFDEKLSADDLIIQSLALVSKKVNDKLHVGGGIIYTTQFGKPTILPTIQIKYKKGKHDFNAFLPTSANYFYNVGVREKLRIGLKAGINGANFNITTQDFSNSLPSPVNKIIYSRVNLGPVINFKITKVLQIEIFGGASVTRKFQLVDFGKNDLQFDTENGSFFNISLKLTPAKKE